MKLFYTFIILLTISCSKELKEKKTITNGGITTYFEVNNENVNFEKNLRNRLDFLSNKESFEYDLSKENNTYIIKFPFILSKNRINSLLFSQGRLFIKKGDSIFFDSNSFKKNKINSKELPFNGFSLNFKEDIKDDFKNFSKKYINNKIEIYIDSTLIMSPKIRSAITDGKLLISSSSSDAYDSDIISATLNYPYENIMFNKVKQKMFLKNGTKLVEIPQIYNRIYNQLQNFVLAKGLTIIKKNKNLNSKEELKTSLEVSMISHNDFYRYLVVSKVKSISELKNNFLHFQGYLTKYNYQKLNKQIDSL